MGHAPGIGVNIAGLFRSEKGVGEAARATVRALRTTGIPYALNEHIDPDSENVDFADAHFHDDNPHALNLVHFNPPELPGFLKRHGAGYLRQHYNIGFWNWEMADFPPEWLEGFRHLHELWAPSRFTQKALAQRAPVPVRLVPFAVEIPGPLPPARDALGLPDDRFLFLFAFDFQSVLARKNPLAVVEAFRRACAGRKDVGLVIKTTHADKDPAMANRLRVACADLDNIHHVDEVLGIERMRELMASCDSYVSLHRSEGYGLTMAEAMALAKPVVATGYSANLDFMNDDNSLLVDYKLVPVAQDYGLYRRGMSWAEPSVSHAARQMKRLVDDRDLARRLGVRARQDIASQLSAERVGAILRDALEAAAQRARATIHAADDSLPGIHTGLAARCAHADTPLEVRSGRAIVGPVIHSLRKLATRLLNPVLTRQAAYNHEVAQLVDALHTRLEAQAEEIDRLRQRVLDNDRSVTNDD